MSIEYCARHDLEYDIERDEGCFKCVWEEDAAIEADRQYDEQKLRELEEKEWLSQQPI